jgi:hypothetical protein
MFLSTILGLALALGTLVSCGGMELAELLETLK